MQCKRVLILKQVYSQSLCHPVDPRHPVAQIPCSGLTQEECTFVQSTTSKYDALGTQVKVHMDSLNDAVKRIEDNECVTGESTGSHDCAADPMDSVDQDATQGIKTIGQGIVKVASPPFCGDTGMMAKENLKLACGQNKEMNTLKDLSDEMDTVNTLSESTSTTDGTSTIDGASTGFLEEQTSLRARIKERHAEAEIIKVKNAAIRRSECILTRSGSRSIIPELLIVGGGANAGTFSGGVEYVFDFYKLQTGWFYYGGITAVGPSKFSMGVNVYISLGWKANQLTEKLENAYPGCSLALAFGAMPVTLPYVGKLDVSVPLAMPCTEVAQPSMCKGVFTAGISLGKSVSVPVKMPNVDFTRLEVTHWMGTDCSKRYWKKACFYKRMLFLASNPVTGAVGVLMIAGNKGKRDSAW